MLVCSSEFFYVYEGKIVMPLGLGGLGQLRIRFRS
jgi:hypothetical protein